MASYGTPDALVVDMSHRDEQLEVLRAIWGEMKFLTARANETNARLAPAGEHVAGHIDRLSRQFMERIDRLELRQSEMGIEIVTELVANNSAVRDLLVALREMKGENDRVDRLEQRIDALERRGG